MPSPLTSLTDNSDASTLLHCPIQVGKASKELPTRLFMTSNFTSRASAGTLRYSSAIKNSDHATDVRASATLGTVK